MQQLTYKGKNLDAIMKRIADDHGENARIVAVDKGRFGGILGFFQREEHVLVAEVDDDASSGQPARAAAHADIATARRSVARDGDRELADPDGDEVAATTFERVAQSIEELLANQAESTEDVFEVASSPRRPKTFGEALDAVTGSLGERPSAMPEGLRDSSMDWAEFAMRNFGIGADEPATSTPVGDPDDGLDSGEMMWRLRSAGYPAKLLAELVSYGTDGATLERAFTITASARALPLSPGSLIAVVGPTNRAVEHAGGIAAELPVGSTALALVTRGRPPKAGATSRRSTPDWRVVPDRAGPPSHAVDRRSRRPTLATRFEPGMVARNLDEIADLSGGWRRDRIGVVAVSWDMRVSGYDWVRNALRALIPNYVGLVVKATAKTEDLARTAEVIGGVDALFLDGLDESMTALSALGSGIPVARIEGRPATATAWMAALAAMPVIRTEG